MAYTILIIDDEPMLTDLLSEHLTHHGYRTHTANNSAQALELLRDQPDLIVLDLALPDGLKLCQQIHNYGAYPLLLLTDHIPQPSQADGFQADKDSYLTKPFRLCELTAHNTAHLPQVPTQISTQAFNSIGQTRPCFSTRWNFPSPNGSST